MEEDNPGVKGESGLKIQDAHVTLGKAGLLQEIIKAGLEGVQPLPGGSVPLRVCFARGGQLVAPTSPIPFQGSRVVARTLSCNNPGRGSPNYCKRFMAVL